MVLKIEDRVRETTTTTGTGTLDLLGPVTGFQSFVTAIGDGNTSYYAIVHRTADEWELGIGTVDDQTTDTLARTTVVSSSNSGNAVSFSAGVKDVFVTLPSSKSLFITGSDSVVIGNGATGVDYSLTFDGETNDGVLTWMEDEDYFQLSDDLLLSTTEKLYFRDTAISINSSADGQLDLIADTEIQIAATTVDINGAVDISGTLGVTGVVSGAGFTAGNAVLAEAELELLDGLTAGTAIASKVVTTDANIDTTGQRNITLTGELDAGSLDIEGDADINGTLEADAITVAGVALNTVIAGVTITNATNAVNSTHVSVADNESTNEENLITFIENASATGNVGLESDGDFAYNPSTGTVSATIFKGNIDAVDGDFDGTLEADAITVAGTALATVIAGTTVTNATNSTHVSVADNESTNEENLIPFIEDTSATGNVGLESDGDFAYNPSTGTVSATIFKGNIDAVDGDFDGTLEADAITVAGTALASVIAGTTVANATLAATVTVADSTANTNFPVVFHNESNALLDDTGALRYNPSTGELLVPKLTVAGTTTTVDTVTMNAENAIVFEGATADAHETTLTIIDPTDDRTINLPNQSGTVPVLAAASNTAVTSTPEELNVLDGITAVVGELNALDIGSTAVGTAVASKAVILDSNKDYTGFRNFTATGDVEGASVTVTDGVAISASSGDVTVANATSDKDLIFTVNDGGSATEVMRLDGDVSAILVASGKELRFADSGEKISGDGTDLTIASGAKINLTATSDVVVPANVGITFGTGEKIEGDNTDLTLTSGADITLAATADVNIPVNVGLRFGDGGENIETDNTDLTITSGAKINLAATSDIHIPNDVGIVFGGASEKIEGDGTDLVISANNLTVDAAADIILDAGGNDFQFKSGGTHILSIVNSSSDIIIKPIVDAKDIIFQQRDGTEVARIEDNATFNVVTGKLAINGTAISSTAAELNALDGITAVVGELNALDIGSTAVGTAVASKAVILDSNKDYTGIRNLTITGELDAATLDISGAIDVAGTANLDVVDIDGAVDMATTLTLAGNADFNGDLDVDGTTNLDVVDIDGAVNMATTALVTGVLTTTAATVFNGGFASNGASSIGGTTPTLTIGDAGAEDAKIIFDGNAQDFHIGLDDSGDKLTIGLGSTLGTTPGFTMDENTNVVFPDNSVTIISSGNNDNLTLISTDTDANAGPNLHLYRNQGTDEGDDDVLGQIKFSGRNDNAQDVLFYRQDVQSSDVSDGAEDAQVRHLLMINGSETEFLRMNPAGFVLNEGGIDMDFRVESSGKTHAIFVDGGNDHVCINTSDDLGGDLNVDGGIVVQNGSNLPQLTLISTDQDNNVGPVIKLYRNSSSPADGDQAGYIRFDARNSASQDITVANIFSFVEDITDSEEDGAMLASVMLAGTARSRIWMGSVTPETVFNDDSQDIDFRVESNNKQHMIFVDAANDHVNIGTATDLGGVLNVAGNVFADGFVHDVGGTELGRMTSSGNNMIYRSTVVDGDLVFQVNAGGAFIGAMTFDASAAGLATFNSGIITQGDSRINVGNNNNQALQIGSSDDNKEAIRIVHSDADNPRGIVIAYTGGAPDSAGADKFISCGDTGAERFHVDAAGDILADGVANASDERLKENIADATAKWDDIKALKVRNFTWKAEHHPNRTHKHIGFIAQEFETVFPALVKERNLHPDPTYVEADKDADGNLPEGKEIGDAKNTKNMKTIHTTAMIPMLTKALQEAMAKIETLETKVAALE